MHSHVAETGEAPVDAFGPAKDHAGRIADALGLPRVRLWTVLSRGLRWPDLVTAVASGLGCCLLADGLWSLGAGTDGVLGLPAWAQVAAAAAVVAVVVLLTVHAHRRRDGTDPVVDPRTGADTVPLGTWRVVLLAALPVVALAGTYLGGSLAGG